MNLSDEQQGAHDHFVSRASRHNVLTGNAGTGKTTTVSRIVDTLLSEHDPDDPFSFGPQITMAAPTHKAVAVMRRMAMQAGFGHKVRFTTVHAMLNLKATVDEHTGEEYFVKSNWKQENILDATDVLIVDEISMIGNKPMGKNGLSGPGLYDELMNEIDRHKRIRTLFVGDPYQIPPVKEDDSPLFSLDTHMKYGIHLHKLTTVMRQALESPIIRYATELRTHKRRIDPPEEVFLGKAEDPNTIHQIESLMLESFTDPRYKDDTDLVKVIAWRNITVDYFNTVARQLIYNTKKLPALMEDERILVHRQHVMENGDTLPTNTELTVHNIRESMDNFYVRVGTMDKPVVLKIYNVTCIEEGFAQGEDTFHSVDILHPDSQKEYEKWLSAVKSAVFRLPPAERSNGWKEYYRLFDRYLRFRYNYAITAHKSQGSTYERALVMDFDIAVNKNQAEANRIRYVAVTRPKSELYVVT